MEHPGEIWQELDYNGERLGGIEPAKLDEDKVRRFSSVAIMLYRYKDGEVEFLFQHRSKFLKGNPDKWDVSAGGHVNLDEEKIDAAVRETKEEIGIDVDAKNLELAGIFIRWKIFVCLYFYDWTGKDDTFSFNDEEVEEVKWVKYSDFNEFIPNLKWTLAEDKLFRYYLNDWNDRILEKYGDNQSR